jgi:hypothetical protein
LPAFGRSPTKLRGPRAARRHASPSGRSLEIRRGAIPALRRVVGIFGQNPKKLNPRPARWPISVGLARRPSGKTKPIATLGATPWLSAILETCQGFSYPIFARSCQPRISRIFPIIMHQRASARRNWVRSVTRPAFRVEIGFVPSRDRGWGSKSASFRHAVGFGPSHAIGFVPSRKTMAGSLDRVRPGAGVASLARWGGGSLAVGSWMASSGRFGPLGRERSTIAFDTPASHIFAEFGNELSHYFPGAWQLGSRPSSLKM